MPEILEEFSPEDGNPSGQVADTAKVTLARGDPSVKERRIHGWMLWARDRGIPGWVVLPSKGRQWILTGRGVGAPVLQAWRH